MEILVDTVLAGSQARQRGFLLTYDGKRFHRGNLGYTKCGVTAYRGEMYDWSAKLTPCKTCFNLKGKTVEKVGIPYTEVKRLDGFVLPNGKTYHLANASKPCWYAKNHTWYNTEAYQRHHALLTNLYRPCKSCHKEVSVKTEKVWRISDGMGSELIIKDEALAMLLAETFAFDVTEIVVV